jgi:hypothetical protein
VSRDVRFSVSPPGADRIHHVTEEDVRVLLERLPSPSKSRLRAVHFNDRSRGARRLGYVNRGRREIVLCALPPRMSLARFLVKGESPRMWGARRGAQWPELAIRRYLLYDVFLHELGHLQVIEGIRSGRPEFAREKVAEGFASVARGELWSQPFDHPDPVHGPPTDEELAALEE